jgi:ATP-dependent RNA helicase RhlE
LLRAVDAEGYTEPTPIQEQAIPYVLAGRDLVACAQTGTGKTAAFALPILQRLAADTRKHGIRVLVLTPTRELATQIGESFSTYGRHTGFRNTVIFGGVNQNPQVKALRRGVDILVATPGRLLDLMTQGEVNLRGVEILVLDEADRMLDMGFIRDVQKIIDVLPKQRQTLLFSATMPQDIQDLAKRVLINPAHVEVTPQATTVEKIDQSVFFVDSKAKTDLLLHILRDRTVSRVLVFTRTKHRADRVVKQLSRERISAEAIHGNKSQNARERALDNFKSGRTRVLVATDIAARGLDIDDVTHIVNYDLPNIPESYVHRIGRTARAGATGIAFAFCDADERKLLRDIEKVTRQKIAVVADHPFAGVVSAPVEAKPQPQQKNNTTGKSRKRNYWRNRKKQQS